MNVNFITEYSVAMDIDGATIASTATVALAGCVPIFGHQNVFVSKFKI